MEQIQVFSVYITRLKTRSVGISKSTYFDEKIKLLDIWNLVNSKLIVQCIYFSMNMILSCENLI
jgi:hypothetical protein